MMARFTLPFRRRWIRTFKRCGQTPAIHPTAILQVNKVPAKQTSLKQPRNVPWQEPDGELTLSFVALFSRAQKIDMCYLFARDAVDSSHTAVWEPTGDGAYETRMRIANSTAHFSLRIEPFAFVDYIIESF
jgi:hypothetical protein